MRTGEMSTLVRPVRDLSQEMVLNLCREKRTRNNVPRGPTTVPDVEVEA